MYYTSITDANGNEFKIAVNIAGHGAPTEEAVAGMFYLDLDSGTIYKCFGGDNWEIAIQTPIIAIKDGNWYINGEDTGEPAQGKQGDPGPAGTTDWNGITNKPATEALKFIFDDGTEHTIEAYVK